MSMTDEKKSSAPVSVPAARALRKELFSDELLDQLMSRVDLDGVALTGAGGFLARAGQGGRGAWDGRQS